MILTTANRVFDVKAAVELLRKNAIETASDADAPMIRSIDIDIDGRTARFDVLGYDIDVAAAEEGKEPEHTATLQMHFLTDEMIPFCDEKRPDIGQVAPNKWSTSTIRQRINDEEFIEEHFGDLADYIVPAVIKAKGDDPVIDRVFILSKEEINSETTPYIFYKNNESRTRVTIDGEPDWYWTRSAYRGGANSTWCVSSGGSVTSSGAYGAYRALPSLVIDIS